MTRSNHPHIRYAIHQSQKTRVLAIWPTMHQLIDYWWTKGPDGQVRDSDLKGWFFMDDVILKDQFGNRQPDHQIRGVRNGTLAEGEAFLDLCRELGLVVESCDWYVPFANGKARGGASFSDFPTRDLRYLRMDQPPSREELIKLAKA